MAMRGCQPAKIPLVIHFDSLINILRFFEESVFQEVRTFQSGENKKLSGPVDRNYPTFQYCTDIPNEDSCWENCLM